MAQLDKTFPTLDCSICILGPLMVDVSRRPNVKLLTSSEVEHVDGYVGNFRITVARKAQYVDQKKCNACGECAKVCPVEVPNNFEVGLDWRKAIYTPFPQAVPSTYVLNDKDCLGLLPLACSKCREACDKSGAQAINYDARPELLEFQVGTIIVATGYDLLDASSVKEYGYGIYSNVMTCLELERMINAAGPTGGSVVRPSDKRAPKRVAFIQCVGSRDEKRSVYCSGFCCMYTIKNAILLKDHYPDLEISIFYIDIRTAFKGYEEFYHRAREMGINFIRGKPAEVSEDPTTGNLVVYSENQLTGKAMTLEADLVVLAQSAVPRAGTDKLTRTLNIMADGSGFLLEAHPKLKPIDTSTSGIFICGSAQGPKDIPYSVAQGSAAAARAARILSKDKWSIEPIVASVMKDLCIRGRDTKIECGICVTRCAFQAISAEKGQTAIINPAKCQGCGTCVAECPHNAITQMHFTDEQILSQIRELLRNEPEKKILAFLCNWCSYAGADLAGTSRFEYPPNVRTVRVMCSGRVDRDFVTSAFTMGAGMVLVSGCRLTEMGNDCHYISGNVWAKKRVETLRRTLEATGISGERLRLEWISAAEGQKFADLIRDMNEKLKSLRPNKVREENEKAKPNLERMLKHSTPPQQTITAKIE